MGTGVEFIILILLCLNLIILISILKSGKNSNSKEFENAVHNFEIQEERMEHSIKDEIIQIREETGKNSRQNREEISNVLNSMADTMNRQMVNIAGMQKNQLDTFSNQLVNLTGTNEDRMNKMRDTIEQKLTLIQNDNNKKLEEMRVTVDEKLHATLETRLGESFKMITEKLETLYKELGEMHSLANGVNDLKKALTNVKTRGIWGEIQLGNIIDEIMTKDQYDTNVITKKGSNDRVEFAIKLPGNEDINKKVYLPIDAKFPQEDYQKLLDAEDKGDKVSIDELRKALENRIKSEAKTIKEKYLDPPNTTDFGILFLPTESLYAEVVKSPGLIDTLQLDYRVIITGPTTISALLNSLQMGFRTLAIEKRSSEVWSLLGAVKTEFGKFGDALEKTQKKLQEASNTIDDAARKTRKIENKLKNVQELPAEDSKRLLDEENETN